MKRLTIFFTTLFFSVQLYSQGCYDPTEDFIKSITSVNLYNAGFHLPLPGNTIDTKSEYFVEAWTELKMSKIDSDIGYVANQNSSNPNNFVRFTQTYKGNPIEGSQLILGFNNQGYLTQLSHYGIDDSRNIPIGKLSNSNALLSMEDQSLEISNFGNKNFALYDGISFSDKEQLGLLKTPGGPPPPPPPPASVSGSIWVGTYPVGYTYECDIDIVMQNGLQEVGVGGSQAGMPNNRLTLVLVNGKYKIADLNSEIVYSGSISYSNPTTDYLVCPEKANTVDDPAGKFEYAMCYNYLTHFSEFFNANFPAYGVDDFGTVAFDPYDGIGSLTYTVSNDKLTFGSADNDSITGYHDLAEDVHFIAEGGAHYWWKNNFSGNMPSEGNTGDGVLFGSLDYMASQFTGGSIDVLNWGGNGSSRTVGLSLGFNYGNFINSTATSQTNGQLWGSTLNDIATESQLGSNICNQLLARAMNLMNNGTGQIQAAIIVFNQGKAMRDEGLITNQQLCILAGILENRYPSAGIAILAKDVYIKDSFAGQQTSYGTNTEDMGEEPSLTTNFWISPAIWNRHAPDQGTYHQNPTHDMDQLNYLHVEVRDRGCFEKPTGELKMYFSEASTGHLWPEDWNNVTPTNNHLGYFVGSINLENNTTEYFDNNNELVYLYIVPWTPLDPTDFDGYGIGDNMHGCMLGRIDSGEDPMFNEQNDVHVSVNSKNNNNIAMRNMTLMHIESSPMEPPNVINQHVLIIKHGKTPDLVNLNPVKDLIKINVLPGGPIQPDELFDYGNIEIELDETLLKAWVKGGMKGQNVKFEAPNLIKIFDPEATIENLTIDPLRKHPIRVRFNRVKDMFDIAEFDITLWNENECEVGGELYKIVPNVELGFRSSASNRSMYSTILSPNPVADELLIESNNAFDISQIKLYDTSGRFYFPEMVTKNEKMVLINTLSLQSGIYIINIERGNGDFENMKFIKL